MDESTKKQAVQQERYKGVWVSTGTEISFKREWSGVRFSDEQCEELLSGNIIEFEAISKKTGNPYSAKGSLAEQEYQGKKYIGFKPDFNNSKSPKKMKSDNVVDKNENNSSSSAASEMEIDIIHFDKNRKHSSEDPLVTYRAVDNEPKRYSGIWAKTGKEISFKREWGGMWLYEDQCKALLNGDKVYFDAVSKKTGNRYIACLELAEQEYQGRNFIGLQNNQSNFPNSYFQHIFNIFEREHLEKGYSVLIDSCINKDGNYFSLLVYWADSKDGEGFKIHKDPRGLPPWEYDKMGFNRGSCYGSESFVFDKWLGSNGKISWDNPLAKRINDERDNEGHDWKWTNKSEEYHVGYMHKFTCLKCGAEREAR